MKFHVETDGVAADIALVDTITRFSLKPSDILVFEVTRPYDEASQDRMAKLASLLHMGIAGLHPGLQIGAFFLEYGMSLRILGDREARSLYEMLKLRFGDEQESR